MRATFIASEVGIGLRRNLTMTIAVVVTTAVSLTFVGLAFMLRAQIAQMKDYWYDRVEVTVFLCGPASDAPTCTGQVTDAQRSAIQAELQALPQVDQVFYESQQQAFERFRDQFEDSALSQNIDASALPESFRVSLVDPEEFDVVAAQVATRPGVEQVQDQKRLLEPFFAALNNVTLGAVGLAAAMLVTAIIMISTTVRLAAFDRRRETGIMRLVGASGLYIMLPFLLEGAIAGLVGSALAGAVIAGFQKVVILDWAVPQFPFTAFIGWDEVWLIVAGLVVLGVTLSAVASLVTLRRYLKV